MPVVSLFLTWVIGKSSLERFNNFIDIDVFVPVPYIFGLEYKAIKNLAGEPIMIDNCDKWFFFEFEQNATKSTKQYWGHNDGRPWGRQAGRGLIDGRSNILSASCNQKDVKRMVPYFKDWHEFNEKVANSKYKDMDDYLFQYLDVLGTIPVGYENRTMDGDPNVRALPDAVYRVQEANQQRLIYDVRVNDNHMWQYHRENGLTKVGIEDSKHDLHTSVHRAMEGQVEAASIINKAYIRNNFKNVTVMTGINIYPLHFDYHDVIDKFQSMESVAAVPFSLCLSFPVFMYTLVLEKEKRLIESMKINGLQLKNYWMVNYVFNYLYYIVTIANFLTWGVYVFELGILVKTSIPLLLVILNGWGLAQISWAFFIQVFIKKSSPASVVGYGLSVYLMLVAQIIHGLIRNIPRPIPWYSYFIPTFMF